MIRPRSPSNHSERPNPPRRRSWRKTTTTRGSAADEDGRDGHSGHENHPGNGDKNGDKTLPLETEEEYTWYFYYLRNVKKFQAFSSYSRLNNSQGRYSNTFQMQPRLQLDQSSIPTQASRARARMLESLFAGLDKLLTYTLGLQDFETVTLQLVTIDFDVVKPLSVTVANSAKST